MKKKKSALPRKKRPPVSQRLTKLEEAMELVIDRLSQIERTQAQPPATAPVADSPEP